MIETFRNSPHARDQAVGLAILFAFCFLSYSFGFSNGKEAGRLENPQAVALDAAAEAHMDKIVELAANKSEHACAALASMLPK